MSEQHYVRKALEEVVRLADEKTAYVEETLAKREDELRDISRSYDETIGDMGHYFVSLSKQLEKWRNVFTQEIQKSLSDSTMEFRSNTSRIRAGLDKLKELREMSAQILAIGQCSDPDLVYQVHSCIFSINQDLEALSEFIGNCIPLKFVGKLNFEHMQKTEVGCLERLSDIMSAEILPSKLPKIKLGQLFHLDFRISKKYCEAARKFITYSVTKDDEQFQKVCAYLHDNKDGTYSLSFPITVIIPHTVNVWYLGEHIRNSPYTIVFKVGPNQVVSGPTQNTMFPNKELSAEPQSASGKLSGRPTGDDREALKRGKWQGTMENNQQNNNWSTSECQLDGHE